MTRQIRRWRPDLVIAMNPNRTYNLGGSHRDHRITAGVALDCVYPLARDHLSFPELMPEFEAPQGARDPPDAVGEPESGRGHHRTSWT